MLLTLAAFVIVVGVLIFVHEAGHFLAAKISGVQVLRFSLGFGRPLVHWRRGETEYMVCWIPLGGYVKMAGLEDEGAMGEVEGGTSETPVDPARAFDKQGLPARIFIILAGVTMNAVFAWVLYTGLAATVGEARLPITRVDTVWSGLLPAGAESLGTLHRGDRIVAINAQPVTTWEDIQTGLRDGPDPLGVTVQGRAQPIVLRVPRTDIKARLSLAGALDPLIEPVIDNVAGGSPASRARFAVGDRVVSVDRDTIRSWGEFTQRIRAQPHRTLSVAVVRGGTTVVLSLTPERRLMPDRQTGRDTAVGYAGLSPVQSFIHQQFGIGASVVEGWRATAASTAQVARIVAGLFTGSVSLRELGGPITIGQQAGQTARLGIPAFVEFMAFISLNLAVLNLLPIPILDGGQVVFLLAEAVRRKPLSVQVRLRLTQVGFYILLAIMALALSNDVIRLFTR